MFLFLLISFSFGEAENGNTMNTLESPASAEPFTTEAVINRTLGRETEGGRKTSTGDIAESLERVSELLPEEEQAKAREYVAGLQTLHRDTIITTLDPGLGGLYNGSERFVATSTLEVDGRDPMEAIEQAKEADNHEKLHETGDHTGMYETYESPDGSSSEFLILGGAVLDQTALIEGRTVRGTGDRFVSEQYKAFKEQYIAAIASSGFSEEEVNRAVDDTHDLSAIDDRERQKDAQDNPTAKNDDTWNEPAPEGTETIAL